MFGSRLCLLLLLLLAVAIPVQTIAAVSPQLTRFEHVTSGGPSLHGPGLHGPGLHGADVQMDCHVGQASDVPELPSCCGDACPDMTVCAAGHALSPATVALSPVELLMSPADHYLFPPVSARLSSPFRPPTISHV